MIDSVDEAHYTIDGKKYARVTSIVKFSGLSDFSGIPERDREHYFKRGTENHRLWQMVEEGTADGFTFDPVVEQYRAGHAKFLRDTGFKAFDGGIEKRVKNEFYGYAGTLDRLGMIGGRMVLLDYKTSALTAGTSLQTALYLLAMPELAFYKVARYCVAIRKDGTYTMSTKYPDSDRADAIYFATKFRKEAA